MLLRAAALAVVVLFAWPLPSSGQATSPHLIIADIDVARATSPQIQNGVLLLPADLVARTFGATAAWDAPARTLTLTAAAGTVVRLVAGQARAEVDGARRDLPAAPVLRDGTLWAPAVALLRALGAYVVDADDPDVAAVPPPPAWDSRRAAGGRGGRTQLALAQVTNISWRADGAGLAVRVSATGPVHVDAHLLHQPERLVVDLGGAVARLTGPLQDIGVAGVLRVRGGQFQLRPFITRIVFDLDHAMKFTVASRPGEVALALGDVAAQASHPPATAASPPTPVRTSPAPTGPGLATPHDAPADLSGVAPEPLAPPPLPEFVDRPGAFHVRAVAYDDQGRAGRITIQASQRVAYALHQFVYPDRLAIDITGGVYLARRQDIEIGSETVRNIVVSQFQLKPNLTRVLVHLNHKMPYSAAVADGGRTLVVTLGNPGRRLARGSAVILDPGHGGIVFVSIHANASRNAGAAGTETYYKTPESQALARVVQAEVTQALGEPDRGVRTADFYVLVTTPMPSVLVETAFITNPSEEAMLRDPVVQRRIAEAIARAIAKYLAAERQPAAP